jgi:hypothetical protein
MVVAAAFASDATITGSTSASFVPLLIPSYAPLNIRLIYEYAPRGVLSNMSIGVHPCYDIPPFLVPDCTIVFGALYD